jgi:hypothetical protein
MSKNNAEKKQKYELEVAIALRRLPETPFTQANQKLQLLIKMFL